MRKELVCMGKACIYYNKYYDVQETGHNTGNFIPMLNSTDERCHHPKYMKQPNIKDVDQIGERLVSISKCPKEE